MPYTLLSGKPEDSSDEEQDEAAKAREEKKAKLKAAFDAEYDDGKGDDDFFQGLKSDLEQQAKVSQLLLSSKTVGGELNDFVIAS